MRVIALDLEVRDFVVIDTRRTPRQFDGWERAWHTRDLLARLFEVIEIEVNITADPDQFTRRQVGLLCEHQQEGRGSSEVEGRAQEQIA